MGKKADGFMHHIKCDKWVHIYHIKRDNCGICFGNVQSLQFGFKVTDLDDIFCRVLDIGFVKDGFDGTIGKLGKTLGKVCCRTDKPGRKFPSIIWFLVILNLGVGIALDLIISSTSLYSTSLISPSNESKISRLSS